MIDFANIAAFPYISAMVLSVAIIFGFFLFWKRNIIIRFANGKDAWRVVRGRSGIYLLKIFMVFVLMLLCGILLLRPQWGEREIEVSTEGADVLIMLDVSRSMMANDAGGTRLSRAKDAVRIILESNQGGRTGLILFAGDAFLQCPLTSDRSAFQMFLDSASPDSVALQGTDLGRALDEAFRVFKKKRLTTRMAVIITDGEDHEGAFSGAVSKFRELGVSLYPVGVGGSGAAIPAGQGGENLQSGSTDVKSAKNEKLLRKIASDTGGSYIDITGGVSGISAVTDLISSQKKKSSGPRKVKEKVDRYHIFAILFLLLAATELFLSDTRRIYGGKA